MLLFTLKTLAGPTPRAAALQSSLSLLLLTRHLPTVLYSGACERFWGGE